MLGDKAYDGAELREDLYERGTKPVIPNRCNRKQPFSLTPSDRPALWRQRRIAHPLDLGQQRVTHLVGKL